MPNKPIMPTHLTVPQVARKLRCGRNAVYAAIAAGHLPAVRVGGGTMRKRYKIDPAALRGFTPGRPIVPSAQATGASEYAEIGVG